MISKLGIFPFSLPAFFGGLGLIVMIGGIPAACTPVLDHRGNLPEKETLDAIVIGASSRADVQRLLGTPTSVGTFNDKAWYYISRTQEKVAFFKPDVTDQKIVAVYFDDTGLVSEIKQTGLEAMAKIDHESEITPTHGHSIGFFENLFGPIGRYSSKDPIYKAPSRR